MKIGISLATRSGSLLAAVAFLAAAAAPAFVSSDVSAAGLLSTRKITISSSADGSVSTDANGTAVAAGSGGNGAKTNHKFNFTMGTSGADPRSVLIQYCTTPLLDTACTAPTGLDASTITSIAASNNWTQTLTLDTATSTASGGIFNTSPCTSNRVHCITFTRASGNLTGTPALDVSFGTGGGTNYIKNPTVAGTFYARVYVFSDTAYTTQIDAGAVAASINTAVDITAKVQEKLNFSVSAATVAPTTSCTALTGSGSITLGSGGVLDTTQAYDNHTYFRLSTNAGSGTSVQYSGDTLKTAGGANSITAASSSGAASGVGTSQFGLALDSSDTVGGNGYSFTNLTGTSPYASGAGTITNAGTATIAYNTGSMTTPVELASAASGTTVSCDTGSVRYVANISPVTKPGVYKTTINYFAVPTF